MKSYRLSVCQMKVVDKKNQNLYKAESMIREAVSNEKAELVVLPEFS